jgi:hypothetical protein
LMKSHSPLIRQSSIFALAKTHKASAALCVRLKIFVGFKLNTRFQWLCFKQFRKLLIITRELVST